MIGMDGLTDSGHLLAGEVLGSTLLGDVVVQVPAVGLHGWHVQLHQLSCITSNGKKGFEFLNISFFRYLLYVLLGLMYAGAVWNIF